MVDEKVSLVFWRTRTGGLRLKGDSRVVVGKIENVNLDFGEQELRDRTSERLAKWASELGQRNGSANLNINFGDQEWGRKPHVDQETCG